MPCKYSVPWPAGLDYRLGPILSVFSEMRGTMPRDSHGQKA